MPVISGINGAVYEYQGLSFACSSGDVTYGPNTIISASQNFHSTGTTGFEKGHIIALTTGMNTGYYTVSSVSSGTITVSETIATTGDDNTTGLSINEREPGIERCGFYNWTLNYNVEVLDGTNFCESSGGRIRITNITDWDAAADKYFLSTGVNLEDWATATKYIRLFTKYVGIPETTNTAHYFSGQVIVSGVSITAPVDALISQTITFQGVGALTENVRATAWTT